MLCHPGLRSLQNCRLERNVRREPLECGLSGLQMNNLSGRSELLRVQPRPQRLDDKHLVTTIDRLYSRDRQGCSTEILAALLCTQLPILFDKEKLKAKIEETLKDDDVPEKIIKKLRSYFNGAEERKVLINPIIFNQLTLWLLEKNPETKKFFDIL